MAVIAGASADSGESIQNLVHVVTGDFVNCDDPSMALDRLSFAEVNRRGRHSRDEIRAERDSMASEKMLYA
jgi:hypothetical protein